MNGQLRILSSMGNIAGRFPAGEVPQWTVLTALRPLHALMAAPPLLFVATLAVMLFRPPDVQLAFPESPISAELGAPRPDHAA